MVSYACPLSPSFTHQICRRWSSNFQPDRKSRSGRGRNQVSSPQPVASLCRCHRKCQIRHSCWWYHVSSEPYWSVVNRWLTRCKISDVINQLFPELSSDKLSTFSCGHIIPEANLKPLVVSQSPRGTKLEYKAGKQRDPAVVSFKTCSRINDFVTESWSPLARRTRSNHIKSDECRASWNGGLLPLIQLSQPCEGGLVRIGLAQTR